MDYVYFTDCCGYTCDPDQDICPDCGEHCIVDREEITNE